MIMMLSAGVKLVAEKWSGNAKLSIRNYYNLLLFNVTILVVIRNNYYNFVFL